MSPRESIRLVAQTMLTGMPDAVLPLLDVTGAFSRDALDARLAAERHALREAGTPCALLVLEADDLASYGAARAEIQRGIAERLRERHRCWPYRVSDDAFVIPLPDGDEAAGAELAEIVRASVAIRPVAERGITVSVGVAAGIGWDDASLAPRADAALRRAQELGGNAAVADRAGVVTPESERPHRPRRLAAPCVEVKAEKESWWSVLTKREPDAPGRAAAAPSPVAPDPTSVAPAHAVADDLTGTLSKDALSWQAAELAYRVPQNGTQVALVVADLDDFAAINARFGQAAGDDVLREIGRRVRAAGGIAYRVGGDAFAVVLTGEDARRAFGIAERIRGAIAGASAGNLQISASVGVATPRPGEGFQLEAVERRALAAAKAAAHDGVRIDGPAVPVVVGSSARALRVA